MRAANPQARREALTDHVLPHADACRCMPMHADARRCTPMHAEAGLIKSMIANVDAAIQHVKAAAQQLPKIDR